MLRAKRVPPRLRLRRSKRRLLLRPPRKLKKKRRRKRKMRSLRRKSSTMKLFRLFLEKVLKPRSLSSMASMIKSDTSS